MRYFMGEANYTFSVSEVDEDTFEILERISQEEHRKAQTRPDLSIVQAERRGGRIFQCTRVREGAWRFAAKYSLGTDVVIFSAKQRAVSWSAEIVEIYLRRSHANAIYLRHGYCWLASGKCTPGKTKAKPG